MKSGQPALQLAVTGPSGEAKRKAAPERKEKRGEEEDRGRRRGRNRGKRENHRVQEGEKRGIQLKRGE